MSNASRCMDEDIQSSTREKDVLSTPHGDRKPRPAQPTPIQGRDHKAAATMREMHLYSSHRKAMDLKRRRNKKCCWFVASDRSTCIPLKPTVDECFYFLHNSSNYARNMRRCLYYWPEAS